MRSRLPTLVLPLAGLFLATPAVLGADTLDEMRAVTSSPDGQARSGGFPDDPIPGLDEILGLGLEMAPATPLLSSEAELAMLLGGRRPSPDAACHGYTTCPSPQSCGSWSSWYNCDSPCCGYDSLCEAKGTDATLQPKEKFRACVLQDGSDCFEYTVTTTFRLHCGCSGVPEC